MIRISAKRDLQRKQYITRCLYLNYILLNADMELWSPVPPSRAKFTQHPFHAYFDQYCMLEYV